MQTVSMAVKRYPSNEALLSGAIAPQCAKIAFDEVEPIHNAFAPMAQKQIYDLSEMAIFTFLQAYAYGKPLVLMPVVMASRHQHGCIIFNTDFHKTLSPQDLAGKRVGVRAYTQTTGAWVRNILIREHGLKLDSVDWIVTEGAHLLEYKEPAFVRRAAPGKKLIDMLIQGEVDAAILGNDLPEHPKLRPVIPDAAAAGPAWHARTGLIPINHMFVATEALASSRPDVLREVYDLFRRAKAAAPQSGPDMKPIGVEAIRPSLELVIDLAAEQQIIPKRYTVDELFAPWRKIERADG